MTVSFHVNQKVVTPNIRGGAYKSDTSRSWVHFNLIDLWAGDPVPPYIEGSSHKEVHSSPQE